MNEEKIGVEGLLELSGADREAKAYAFLYAAFKRTEISSNPVRDALDCLIPFIGPYLKSINGKQVQVDKVQEYLKTNFGFDIPLYALDQLMSALVKAGFVKFNRNLKAFFAEDHDSDFDIVKTEIETDFDEVVSDLNKYALEMGFDAEPPSGTWGEALIVFLTSKSGGRGVKAVNVKGALIDPSHAEGAIVGAFIKILHKKNPDLFKKLLNIFMGVLVEEFISSVSEIGGVDLEKPVVVFYDTAVLMRLLSCSGRLLKTATDELNRYLQDLGYQMHFFAGNEAEVSNILDTIIHRKDTGQELEGETAEAIGTGEISITDIRMLQNTFTEKLAAMNVFPAEGLEKSVVENAKYQIDERAFQAFLKQEAYNSGKTYGFQNLENDAGYLSAIMRLRQRNVSNDLAGCGFVFVTHNKFLALNARRFLIKQKVIKPQQCPPMLSVGQIATIVWLMKDQKLEPEKAGRELLSNCFAAIRPDHEWFKHFREGIESLKGNVEEYVSDPSNMMVLQATRRIAQEESFGESAVVRELNMVEIIQRAEQETKNALSNMEAQKTREIEDAKAEATEKARRDAQKEADEKRYASAEIKASKIISRIKFLIWILLCCVIGVNAVLQLKGVTSILMYSLTGVIALLAVLQTLDFLGIAAAKNEFDRLHRKIVKWLVD